MFNEFRNQTIPESGKNPSDKCFTLETSEADAWTKITVQGPSLGNTVGQGREAALMPAL